MVEPARETYSATGRVLAVLDAFDQGHRRLSLSAIARRSGLPLTSVHRLVHALEVQGALTRSADGDYEMGSRIWRLGILASVHADLRELALPYMEDVYELTNAAVQIAVLDGLRCLIVDRIAGSRTRSVLSKPGSRLPLHATGVGKVLLAFGGSELQDAVLGNLDRYTDKTITDATLLRSQLRSIVSQGFAQTHEELEAGATSLAVPLRGRGGVVIAALGLVAPSESSVAKLVPAMQVTAASLSRRLVDAGLGDPAAQ